MIDFIKLWLFVLGSMICAGAALVEWAAAWVGRFGVWMYELGERP